MKHTNAINTVLATALFLLMVCLCETSMGQQPPQGATPVANDAATNNDSAAKIDDMADDDSSSVAQIIPLANSASLTSSVDRDDDLINVSVENETLENIVNMFTRISGANIVTSSSDLVGTVTVNLRGVDWKSALSAILDIHDLALTEQLPGSEVYTIVPKPSGEAIPLIVDTIFLHFTTVPEIQPILSSMLSVSNASISAFSSRNALVIRTSEPNMRQLKSMVKSMDVPGEQVVVETKFIELSDSASSQIGIDWEMLRSFGVTGAIGPFGRSKESLKSRNDNKTRTTTDESESSSSRTISDDNGEEGARLFDLSDTGFEDTDTEFVDHDNDPLTAVIAQTDIVPTRTELRTLSNLGESLERRSLIDSLTTTLSSSLDETVSKVDTAILGVDQLNIVLSALKENADAKVVSNPKLVVASGEENAFFSVGEREPIVKVERRESTQENTGDLLTATLDTSINTDFISDGYLRTGIELKVAPVVKTQELIEAAIEPRLSTLIGQKVVADNSFPIISTKELKTVFTLRSGQTVAIGGLTDTKEFKAVKKVPVLGDIPFIGKYVFSHTSSEERRVETIIFVTLTIADPELLYNEVGIPGDAELTHRDSINSRARREKFEAELEEMEKVSSEETSRRARARLLQRSE
jgi:type IV pilus assembly protein PilQ